MTKAFMVLFQNEYQFAGHGIQTIINIYLNWLNILAGQPFTLNFSKSYFCQKTLLLRIILIPTPAYPYKPDSIGIFRDIIDNFFAAPRRHRLSRQRITTQY